MQTPLPPNSDRLPEVQDGLGLSVMIGSRICHDLINPLGAIGNGVELLLLETDKPRPEIALIAESITAATNKLRFLRVAMGIARSEQAMSEGQITTLISDYYGRDRYGISWKARGPHARAHVRRALLGVMCLTQAMPMGGELSISQTNGA